MGSTEVMTVNITHTFDDEYSPALFKYNLISQLNTDKESPPNYKKLQERERLCAVEACAVH